MTEPTTSTPSRALPSERERWTATGSERPVFLDERGRRRRWVRAAAAGASTAATLWLAGLVLGAVGFGTLPIARLSLAARHPAAGPPERLTRADARERGRARTVVVAQRAPRRSPRPALVPSQARSFVDSRS